MARAISETFGQMSIAVEFDPVGAADTFTTICGLKDISQNRTANVDTDEIPDCDDEDLPFFETKQVRSITQSVTGTGAWAQQSHDKLLDWFESGQTLRVQIRHANVLSGEKEIEEGPALLTQLKNDRTKGKIVSADITVEFAEYPTTIDKA